VKVFLAVIPNGVDAPLQVPRAEGKNEDRDWRKIALFLGRIHPKKGLPMLIEAWARVRPDGWHLQSAGPDEAGHKAEVQNAAFAAGLSQLVFFVGPIESEKKESASSNANLFVLPTHSENFGIAVAEALAHGLPVLTTTGAPWSLLRARSCGWWVDATVEGITEGLRQATSQDPETLYAMGTKGREWVRTELGWERVAKEVMATYEGVISTSISDNLWSGSNA